MKKNLLLLTLMLFSIQGSFAQWIDAMHISPANPTTNDVISFYADVSFPSGMCSDKTQTQGLTGNGFYTYALHCNGPLAFICSTADTFTLGPLPAGNYSWTYAVDAGGAPSPCTPGIVPGPFATINFTVNTVTSIIERESPSLKCFPNPAQDILNISISGKIAINSILYIYNTLGEEMISKIISESDMTINTGELPEGIYILWVDAKDHIITHKFVKQN